jgi:SAM-dependent methyltransferase
MDTERLNSAIDIEPAVQNWIAALERRHLAELTFPEVSRALRALSSTYVERRHRLGEGAALSGAGKRAAFALFYGPLHFLLVRSILQSLPGAADPGVVLDLGCGTGAAGAAWSGRRVIGVDRHPWALAEAAMTYAAFGLAGPTTQADVGVYRLPTQRLSIVAAFTANELTDASRDRLLTRLVEHAQRHGSRILIVEPLAKAAVPWWGRWSSAFSIAGGRADEWRFRVALPEIVRKLDRASGLNHQELTGRTLWLPSPAAARAASR